MAVEISCFHLERFNRVSTYLPIFFIPGFHSDRRNEYDGEEEFWVTIKETGKKTESTSYEELHQQEKEATL